MDYDFSRVVGFDRPRFDAVLEGLKCQIDPAKLTDADRRMIDHGVPETERYSVLKRLLSAGADPARFGWTDIFLALAFGSLGDLEEAVTGNSDLEAVDHQHRTAFLLAIQLGDIDKARLLVEAGANIWAFGHLGEFALGYAIIDDNVDMLQWLLQHGFDPDAENAFGETAVYTAAARGAVKCLKTLIALGADIAKAGQANLKPMKAAVDQEVIRVLLDAGADFDSLEPEQLAALMGYNFDEPPDCSLETYLQYSARTFGRSNPERVHNPFWTAMVRCGGSASLAEGMFSAQLRALRKGKSTAPDAKRPKAWVDPRIPSKSETNAGGGYPIWCYRRFGKSMTRLPDGRIIEIAGEHEDFYDPNFCIYNDVIVHNGGGQCEIYAYPAEVFPPTDFHSATLVGDFIYIIGNLGYRPERRPGVTPVYRLNIHSCEIEAVKAGGDMPGWINRHEAYWNGDTEIIVAGGLCSVLDNGEHSLVENAGVFALDLKSLKWTRKA